MMNPGVRPGPVFVCTCPLRLQQQKPKHRRWTGAARLPALATDQEREGDSGTDSEQSALGTVGTSASARGLLERYACPRENGLYQRTASLGKGVSMSIALQPFQRDIYIPNCFSGACLEFLS